MHVLSAIQSIVTLVLANYYTVLICTIALFKEEDKYDIINLHYFLLFIDCCIVLIIDYCVLACI